MVKRRRKPMSEEQRKAAAKRLAEARAKRGHDGSASVHVTLRDMDEEHPLHWKKVKEWIKEVQEERNAKKALRLSKDRKDRAEYQRLDTYLSNLKKYLDTGVYFDHRYGRHMQGKMTPICLTMAYYSDGEPKRSVGTYYPDLGEEWTREMQDEQNRIRGVERKSASKRKRKN